MVPGVVENVNASGSVATDDQAKKVTFEVELVRITRSRSITTN